MAGPPTRQRTFDLVPETLVPQSAPKKAMTLKQAKKAAAIASRVPKMSRAERARMEKEELDRQRKEREKHRASEKARTAREKKAAKLAEEKAGRKKMGIPEPSRFVRSSQPVISGFVMNGFKRMKTDTESDNDSTTRGTTTHADSEPQKNTSISPENPEEAEESDEEYAELMSRLSQDSPLAVPSPAPELPIQRSASPVYTSTRNNLQAMCKSASEDYDEFDDDQELFAAMSESVIIIPREQLKQSFHNPPEEKKTPTPDDVFGSRNKLDNSTATGAQANMRPSSTPSKHNTETKHQAPEKRLKVSTTGSITKPFNGRSFTPSSGSPIENTIYGGAKTINNISQSKSSNNDRHQPLRQRSTNMLPPPLPPKRLFQSHSALATPLARNQVFPASIPPPSTQAFLRDNVDFFPSPSQELREVQEDWDNYEDSFPTPTQEMRELQKEDEDDAKRLSARSTPISAFERAADPQVFHSGTPTLNRLTTASKVLDDSLNRLTTASKVLGDSSNRTNTSKPKVRFFKEKEEDITHGALVKMQTTTVTPEQTRPAQKRAFSRTDSENSDYGEDALDWTSQEANLAWGIGEANPLM